MSRDPKPGDPVIVRLFDARTVKGQIWVGRTFNTLSVVKVRVRSGDAVYLVNYEQVSKAARVTIPEDEPHG